MFPHQPAVIYKKNYSPDNNGKHKNIDYLSGYLRSNRITTQNRHQQTYYCGNCGQYLEML